MSKKRDNLLKNLTLEQVLRTIPSGLFLVDREQRVVYWNAEAERITGYPAAEVLGRHCSFLAGIPCGRNCGLYNEAVRKPVIGHPCSIKTRDGRRIILAKNVDLLRDATGQLVGGVESFIDITHQKRLEQRLRRQARELERAVRQRTVELEAERNRLRTLLDAMSDLAYITSADFQVEFMNRAMSELFGLRTGERCYEIYGRREVCPWCPLPRVLAGATLCEERFVEANGRTYEIVHTPLRDADGTVHKLSVFRDITERKEAEAKLREANRELDAFVSTVAHELRTPLAPILGFAELLREAYRDRLDEQGLDALAEIERQAERMLALLEDLLVLARVGHLPPPERPVDVTGAVRLVLEELAEPIRHDGIVVTLSDLPPLAVPQTLIAQLFANLVGNAVRYAGGAGARIEIGGEAQGDRVRYFVRDHGPGIPEQERTLVFDPFYRGTAAGKSPGTGIGLATVRKIVRLYSGRVWVEETPGGGCTFRLEFPREGALGQSREGGGGE